MTENDRVLYGKFRKNPKTGLFSSFLISEDKEKAASWKSRSEGERQDEEGEGRHETVSDFKKLNDEFLTYMNMFYRLIPATMSLLQFASGKEIDVRIYTTIKANGKLLSSDERYELYEVPFSFASQIDRLVENAKNLEYGIDSLPGIFLIGLVSYYDAFLSNLIRLIYLTIPEKLSSSERNITFKDLVDLGSVEAAREFILEKEVESVLRMSHHAQIEWLESKLGMALTKDLDIWPTFIEICERRNLFTHTNGVVSSQYVGVCTAHKLDLGGLKVGDKLSVDPKYLRNSINSISEFGLKLIQVVWRKLLPEEIDEAATCLNIVGFRLISRRRYSLASKMLEFGLNVMKRHGSDLTRKMMVVNWANCEKLSGRMDSAEEILAKEDWSASSDKFRICVAAVRDDVKAAVSLLEVVARADQIDKEEFRSWPVFQNMRNHPEFISEFERVFNEPYFTDKENIEGREVKSDQSNVKLVPNQPGSDVGG